MGKSIASKSIKNTDDMKREVEEFLCVILNKSQYLLAGESYGGYLARGLLIDHMNSIDGLLLLCPLVIPGYRKGRVAKKCIVEKDQRFMNKLSEKDRNEFDYLSVIQTKRMWAHYKKEIDFSILPENEGFLEKQLIGNFSYDINTIEMQYDKPTLILVGKQDTEVGYKDQYDLYNGLKRSTILILDKAGHNLQIERNCLFQASFLDWIERIETYSKSDQTTASI
jgi:pimeloyl-ACP methyl ester carboxylesterase